MQEGVGMIFHRRHLWLIGMWGRKHLPARYCRICQRFEIEGSEGWHPSDLHVLASALLSGFDEARHALLRVPDPRQRLPEALVTGRRDDPRVVYAADRIAPPDPDYRLDDL